MDEQLIPAVTEALLPLFIQAAEGRYAFALAGAHAKGRADAHSDLDYFLFAERMKPHDAIKAIFDPVADDPADVHSWDGGIEFYFRGIKVETTVRVLDELNMVIGECLRGQIRIEPEFWTLNGHYNYVHLAEIDFVEPIDDPFHIIRDLKESLSEYPPALRKAIIGEFRWKCRFWVNNFHYASAINRMDIVYTSGVIHNTFHSIVQLLFALNGKYFCGDKKIELQLSLLPFCPKSLADNIGLLMATERDVEFLRRQRSVLNDINDEIDNALLAAGYAG